MSTLKKFNIKEKISISREFFHEFVFVKRSLYALGASLLVSCFIVLTSTPSFYVSSSLMQADTSSSTAVDIGAASSALLEVLKLPPSAGSATKLDSGVYSIAIMTSP